MDPEQMQTGDISECTVAAESAHSWSKLEAEGFYSGDSLLHNTEYWMISVVTNSEDSAELQLDHEKTHPVVLSWTYADLQMSA